MTTQIKDLTGGYGYIDENGDIHHIEDEYLSSNVVPKYFKFPSNVWQIITLLGYKDFDQEIIMLSMDGDPVKFSEIKECAPNIIVKCNKTADDNDPTLRLDGIGDSTNAFCLRFSIPHSSAVLYMYSGEVDEKTRVVVKSNSGTEFVTIEFANVIAGNLTNEQLAAVTKARELSAFVNKPTETSNSDYFMFESIKITVLGPTTVESFIYTNPAGGTVTLNTMTGRWTFTAPPTASKLYEHVIRLGISGRVAATLILRTTYAQTFTLAIVANYLWANGFTTQANMYPVQTVMLTASTNYPMVGVYADSSSSMKVVSAAPMAGAPVETSIVAVQDTVRQIYPA